MLFHTVSILSHAEFGPNDLWENASHLNFPGAFFDILVKKCTKYLFLNFLDFLGINFGANYSL